MIASATPVSLPDTFRPITMASGIRCNLARGPGRVALICADRSLTYGQLVDRIARVGSLGLALGLRPGDRAAIVSGSCLEYLEIVDGLAEAGIAVATPNPRQTATELGFILADCGARVAFVSPQAEVVVRAADCPDLERIIVIGPDYEALLQDARPTTLPQAAEWSAFAIPYTSGTTGKPRGVVLPHRSRALLGFAMASEFGCYGPDDRFLAVTPMFHGAGFANVHTSVFFGGTCEILQSFEPEIYLRRLSDGGATGTFVVPTIFHSVFGLEQPVLDRYRSHRLRALMSNAAALPQKTKEIIVDYFGENLLHEMYGSTEAGTVLNLRPAEQLLKKQCVGHPCMMNQVKLLDDHGNPVKRGDVGELFSTSPNLFLGYWNNPEATAAAMRDGWFSAGDLAWQDGDGCYYIVDRKKDMYISGGVNVYPREIEEFLFRLPGVRDAAVVGIPDDYWGEAGKAFLVLEPGAEVTVESVLAICRDSIAGYKVPRHVVFVEGLPRNPAGKVLKTELRKLG
jgi:acyl-CoA synthetase (AMP-forming)/AMP-acid ligase II